MDKLQIDSFVNSLGVEITIGSSGETRSSYTASNAAALVASINERWAAASTSRGDSVPVLKAGDTVARVRGALVILISRVGVGSSVTVRPISDGAVAVDTAELCAIGEAVDTDLSSVRAFASSVDLTSFLVGAVVGAIVA